MTDKNNCTYLTYSDGASQVVLAVKNLPASAGEGVPSLGQEEPLEEEMATHSVFLPGESHGQRSLVGYSP